MPVLDSVHYDLGNEKASEMRSLESKDSGQGRTKTRTRSNMAVDIDGIPLIDSSSVCRDWQRPERVIHQGLFSLVMI